MARYVMLEFDDNQMAEDFIKAVHEGLGVIYPKQVKIDEDKWESKFIPLVAKVRGLWFKPVNFCECTPQPEDSARNFIKGSRFGVYVHKVCKKPRKGGNQFPKNLLDPKVVPGAPQRIWLNTKEPIDTTPETQVGKVGDKTIPNLGFNAIEPTPKAETDRVLKNLDQLSQS